MGKKKTVKRYLKSEHTHRGTHRHTDTQTFRLIESIGPEGGCFEKTLFFGYQKQLSDNFARVAGPYLLVLNKYNLKYLPYSLILKPNVQYRIGPIESEPTTFEEVVT